MFTALFVRLVTLLGPYAQGLRRSINMALSRGDAGAATGVVPAMILISGFVMICIVLMVWLDKATQNKAADAAVCVERGAVSYAGAAACSGNEVSSNNSFTQDSAYTSRY